MKYSVILFLSSTKKKTEEKIKRRVTSTCVYFHVFTFCQATLQMSYVYVLIYIPLIICQLVIFCNFKCFDIFLSQECFVILPYNLNYIIIFVQKIQLPQSQVWQYMKKKIIQQCPHIIFWNKKRYCYVQLCILTGWSARFWFSSLSFTKTHRVPEERRGHGNEWWVWTRSFHCNFTSKKLNIK